MKEDNIQFTIDVKKMVRQLLADPTTREEVWEALREFKAEGPGDPRKPCGFANFGSQENPEWFSLFLATNREKAIGEAGLFYRTRGGERISARLRKQPTKNQAVEASGQLEAGESTQATNQLPSDHQQLLALALSGNKQAAQALIELANKNSAPAIAAAGEPPPQDEPLALDGLEPGDNIEPLPEDFLG